MRFMFLIVVLVMSCGAAGGKPPKPSLVLVGSAPCQVVHLSVEPSFSSLERRDIVSAMADWRKVSGEKICFELTWRTVVDEEAEARNHLFDGLSMLYAGRRRWQIKAASQDMGPGEYLAATQWGLAGVKADIFMMTRRRDIFRATVAHELGHLLGLRHSLIRKDLMYEVVTPGKRISQRDKTRLQCLLDAGKLLIYWNDCELSALRPASGLNDQLVGLHRR